MLHDEIVYGYIGNLMSKNLYTPLILSSVTFFQMKETIVNVSELKYSFAEKKNVSVLKKIANDKIGRVKIIY